jgi:hypothetical protein
MLIVRLLIEHWLNAELTDYGLIDDGLIDDELIDIGLTERRVHQ